MSHFDYAQSSDPIRPDLAEAYRRTWAHVAAPGTWLTGAERVAVAGETRRARGCALCAERKAALSPHAVEGEHGPAGALSAPLVDAIHRITTDPARLTQAWHDGLLEQGLSDEQYVEALGVAVLVVSIDAFHRSLDLPLEPLPAAEPGEPSRRRPKGVVTGEAWVPMLDPRQAEGEDRAVVAIGPGGQAPYVIRAMSLVPAQVRAMLELSGAQYLSAKQMTRFEKVRAIDRAQIELVAGRVSALNECFY